MDCRICGRQFDALGFQVMVPGHQHAFDRVDCALEANVLEPPAPQRMEPVPPVAAALSPSFAPVPALAIGPAPTQNAASVRPHFFGGANIALLAAGTAATIYLWLRVFGVDAGPVGFLAERASQAFGRTTVAAAVDLTPATDVRPEPENTVRGARTLPAAAVTTASDSDRGRTPVADRSPRKKQGDDRKPRGGPVVRPAPNPPPAEPPAEPSPPRSAPTPTTPVPSSPPEDRVPGPTLPDGQNPEQPTLPGGRP